LLAFAADSGKEDLARVAFVLRIGGEGSEHDLGDAKEDDRRGTAFA
jgi:hypothetical protein